MNDESTILDITAQNEEDALAQAQFELGVSVERLTLDVLSSPDPDAGIDGQYRVRLLAVDEVVSPEVSHEEIEKKGVAVLTEILERMRIDAVVTAAWEDADDHAKVPVLLLNVDGDDAESLVGPRGEAISALQYLVRLIVARQLRTAVNLVVDIDGYKARRAQQLEFLAKRIADQVTNSGRAMHLEPMPAHERRVIHMILRDHPSVMTKSIGEGSQRRVTIVPR